MANPEADTTQLLLGATSALKKAVEKQADIKAVFSRYHILESDYLIFAGFDQGLIEEGAGYFQEIQIFCSNDIPQDTLLRELGKVLSPTPATVFTPSRSHHTPVFDENGKVRSRREVIRLGVGSTRLTMSIPSVLSGDLMQDHSGPSPTTQTQEGKEENNDGGEEECREKGKSKEWQANQDGGGGRGEGDDGQGDEGSHENRDADEHGDDDNKDPDSSDDQDGAVEAKTRPPTVSFDVQAEIFSHGSDEPTQILQINGSLTAKVSALQFIYSMKVDFLLLQSPLVQQDEPPKSQIQFLQLRFQGLRSIPSTVGYEHKHARVIVNTNQPLTRICEVKPIQTPALGQTAKAIKFRKKIAGIGMQGSFETPGFTSSTGGMSFFGARAKEDSFGTEVKTYTSRITQGDRYGAVWWGFSIDDPHDQEAGLKLHHPNTLPRATFEFLDKSGQPPVPKTFDIQVISLWSLIPTTGRNLFHWLRMRTSLSSQSPSYSNLCQVVRLEMPSESTKRSDHMSLTEVRPSGCHLKVMLEGLHKIDTSVEPGMFRPSHSMRVNFLMIPPCADILYDQDFSFVP